MKDNKKRTLYIFDFDDTLVNNHLVDFRSFETIIKKYRLKEITQNKLLEFRKKGFLAQDIFRQLTKGQIEPFVSERRKLLNDKSIWKHLSLNPGVKKTLKKIKEKGDYIIIITRKPKHLVNAILPILKIDDFIDKVYTASKKDIVIKDFMTNSNIVFVSDSEEDLRLVKKLNIKTYCFYNKYKDLEKMNRIAKVINSLEEVL